MAFTAAMTLGTPAPGISWTDQMARIGMGSHATFTGGSTGINNRSGIIPSNGTPLAVVQIPTPSMNVRVSPGTAVVQSTASNGGVFTATLETQTDIQVNTANGSNPRIDVLVVDISSPGSSPTATLIWVQGTAAASPARPSLTPPTNHHYFPVAQVTVPTAATSIVTANITLTSADGLFTAAPGGVVKVATLAAAAGLPVSTPFFDVQDNSLGIIEAGGAAHLLLGGALIKVISQNVTSDGAGDATVQFKQRVAGSLVTSNFPNGFIAAIFQEATSVGSYNGSVAIKNNGGSSAGCNIRLYDESTNTPKTSFGPVTIQGIAFGY